MQRPQQGEHPAKAVQPLQLDSAAHTQSARCTRTSSPARARMQAVARSPVPARAPRGLGVAALPHCYESGSARSASAATWGPCEEQVPPPCAALSGPHKSQCCTGNAPAGHSAAQATHPLAHLLHWREREGALFGHKGLWDQALLLNACQHLLGLHRDREHMVRVTQLHQPEREQKDERTLASRSGLLLWPLLGDVRARFKIVHIG